MTAPLLSVALRGEHDIVVARQRARHVAHRLGFESQDQLRIATAVSELSRNALEHASEGRVEFLLQGELPPQLLAVRVSDLGPALSQVADEAQGASRTPAQGVGGGLLSARRLMDQCEITSAPGGGTTVVMRKWRPPQAPPIRPGEVPALVAAIAGERLQSPLAEVQRQNLELLKVLEELRRRQEDLSRVNRELEETNRGVVALYAELDEKAEHLRRVDEAKTRFLSNMSHEFRTPLNSILAISGLLERRSDGELTEEQARQVRFIVEAATELTALVDDLLDIAKVEAGKIVVRAADFELGQLFGALRGMLRPLHANEAVRLVIEEPAATATLHGDENRVAQILRNLLTNALKFTERGEVQLRAALSADGTRVRLMVSDTGIGIAPEDQGRIFEEFGQVENPLQRRVKGTGLGLALSRRLATVMGGSLEVESQLGRGSTFTLELPTTFVPTASAPSPTEAAPHTSAAWSPSARVLVVDDDEGARYVLAQLLRQVGLVADQATDGEAGLRRLREARPAAVVLDVVMPGLGGHSLLAALRADPRLSRLPVVVATSKALEADEQQDLERLSAVVLPKASLRAPDAAQILLGALQRAGLARGGGAGARQDAPLAGARR
jgi:signal transduction histidine kinase